MIGYVLAYASLVVAFGRAGDLLGHRRVFSAGLLLSGLAFVLCGLAPTYGWLLAFRVLQGIGAALVISCGPALITRLAPERLRGRMLGAYVMIFGLGAALGPALGGVLVEAYGWSAVFWFRVPVVLLAFCLVWLLPGDAAARRVEAGFDWSGASLLALALGCAVAAINGFGASGGPSLLAWLLAGLSAAAAAGFVVSARRTARPLIDLALFGNRTFASVNLASCVVNLVGFAALLLVPYFVVRVGQLGEGLGGLVLAASAVGTIAGGSAGGRLIGRLPAQGIAMAGAALVCAGTWLAGSWPAGAGLAVLCATLFVHGAGLGLFQVSYMEIVVDAMPKADRGVAGSLATLTRTIGLMAGVSLLSLAFEVALMRLRRGGLGDEEAFLAAFQTVFQGSAIALAGFLVAWALYSRMTARRAN